MDLLNYIEKYFHDNSERTILINGKWGSGKTYYIKNLLIPKLELIKNPNQNIIYVSLNGLKTVDELINKIISSKIGLGDKLISGLSTLKGMFDIGLKLLGKDKAKFDEANELILKFMNFSQDFVIFDDLERLSFSFLLTDFFGFINSYLIEHNTTKVLFIADESKISNDNYFEAKEKIIEHTYRFEVNIEKIFNEYIDKIENENVKKFFDDYKNEILVLILKHKLENLRTVFYILKMFTRVIPVICETIDYKKAQSLILFIILISIEVKNGKIKSEDINNKKKLDEIPALRFKKVLHPHLSNPKDKDSQIKKEYHELFMDTYLHHESIEFKYYDSIFKLIINGYIDDEELISDFRPESSNYSEWDLARERMINFRDLDEKEIIGTVNQVYRYAIEKKYNPLSYGYLYYWLNFFLENSILKVTSITLRRKLIIALNEIYKQQGIPTDEMSRLHYSLTQDGKNPVENEISRLLELQKKKDKLQETKEFYNNFNNYKLVFKFFDKYQHNSIINELNIGKLASIIKKAEISSINKFNDLLHHRYGFSNIQEFFSLEKTNISLLSEFLSRNNISLKKYPLKKLTINNLIKTLNDTEGRL